MDLRRNDMGRMTDMMKEIIKKIPGSSQPEKDKAFMKVAAELDILMEKAGASSLEKILNGEIPSEKIKRGE